MDGILIINKDLGYTSRDVVNLVGKYLGTKKVGHTGTLDPMASGVLVICVGKALKVCELLTNHDKEYIAGITLGVETDTLDMEGTILRKENVNIDSDKIFSVVNSFKKTYLQQVPKYSAVKVNGKKLYEYARNNIDVTLPSKEVTIYDVNVLDDIINNNDNGISFKIKCRVSKGTYIRSLIRDIGNVLGVPAVMNSLIRIRQGNFSLNDSFSLKDVQEGNYRLLSILDAFPNIPRIKVDKDTAFKISNGVALNKFFDGELAFILDNNDNLLALYKNIDNMSRAYKMFI